MGDPYYHLRQCKLCGAAISAPPSRIEWVFRMHMTRCVMAQPDERKSFVKNHRWPRRASVANSNRTPTRRTR